MIVVDANILAYHSLPEPRNAETEKLLPLEPEWAAPLLWRSERRNLLCGYMRRGYFSAEQARAVVTLSDDSLKGGEHVVSDHAALTLVDQSRCTAYDCEFVALGHALDCKLVTEDKALLDAFPHFCFSLKQMLRSD